jgi:hypothetical protein
MQTLGHADSAVTLRIYAHVMNAEAGGAGTQAMLRHRKTLRFGGLFETRPAGFEPATFRSGGERSIP